MWMNFIGWSERRKRRQTVVRPAKLSIPENPENLRSRSGSDPLQNGPGSIQDDLERSAGRVLRAGGSALAEVGTRPKPEK